MATQKFKAALNAAQFPVAYAQAIRSVLVPGSDVVPRFGGSAFYGTQDSAEWNTIQLVYCENVLPMARGITSVGYVQQYPAVSPPVATFDQLFLIKDSKNGNANFAPARGANYVFSPIAATWTSYAPFAFNAAFSLVTKAYVNGRTLIFYQQTKCIEWIPATPTLETKTLVLPSGFAITDIRGNCGASNYHILFTDVNILWSSLVDILDFDDVNNGSGNQIPLDLRGKITAVLQISGGFMIYTTENVVAATYSGDASKPFIFREVTGSGGVSGPEQVTGDANSDTHYAYGTAGIQALNLQKAVSIFPESADFLISREMETWNPATKTVDTSVLSIQNQPKLQYLGSRYLFISYGSTGALYQFALVYDTVLQRWGKLRVNHVDIGIIPVETLNSSYLYYQLEGGYDSYTAIEYDQLVQPFNTVAALKQNYGFLQADGTTLLWVPQGDLTSSGSKPIAIFGRVQVTRNRTVTIQKCQVDGIVAGSLPEITILASQTGFTRDSVKKMDIANQVGSYVDCHSRYVALNADIAVEGSFLMTNMVLETTVNGKR